MKLARRAPWSANPGRPCLQPVDAYRACYFAERGTEESVLDFDTRLFQKWGPHERLVRSQHLEFSSDEWENGILDCRWVEVVTVDRATAYRATRDATVVEKATYRRQGLDYVAVYLPVFRAYRLTSLGDFS